MVQSVKWSTAALAEMGAGLSPAALFPVYVPRKAAADAPRACVPAAHMGDFLVLGLAQLWALWHLGNGELLLSLHTLFVTLV